MPELDYALLADAAREQGGTVSILAAGIDTVRSPEEPVQVKMALVMRIGFTRNGCERPHRVEVLIQQADGATVGQLSGTNAPRWPGAHPIHWKTYSALVMNFAIGLSFGEYQVVILLNDHEAKVLPFRVVQVSRPA